MKKEKIETPLVEIPRKGISQAVKFGNILFVSGQVGEDINGKAAEGIQAQTELAIENARKVIEAAGATLDDVLMCRFFLQRLSDFDGMNEVYYRFFGEQEVGPARYTVVASPVAEELLVEVAMLVGLPD